MTIAGERRGAGRRAAWLAKNRVRLSVVAVIVFLLLAGLGGLESGEWFPTLMKGLSVGAVTFLVASGLSLIFGLMDVLNLAHGELFMLGAYMGWTVYTRFDTVVDAAVPLLLFAAPFAVYALWRRVGAAVAVRMSSRRGRRALAWGLLLAGGVLGVLAFTRFPLVIWDPEVYARSPITYSLAVDLGTLAPLPAETFRGPAFLAVVGILVGGTLSAIGASMLAPSGPEAHRVTGRHVGLLVAALGAAAALHVGGPAIDDWVFGLSTTWRFVLAMVVSTGVGAAIGAFIEVTLIRPLYERPIYQLMITLGIGFIVIQLVRDVWGRPEFTMPRPAAFNGTGPGCPGQGIGDVFSGCATVDILGGRLRIYNELFVVTVGILVLVGISLLLRRTRIGMIIRAGVQDSEMVEALGINVRAVFTLVFAIGTGLAALGGVLAAPSIGLSTGMGALLLLQALIALAIGGLTSFPGAAAGAVLVGLLQQLIIRYGQTGIDLPFLDAPFKPSPTVVPAAAVLLMVIVLLVLPTGLFGRSER